VWLCSPRQAFRKYEPPNDSYYGLCTGWILGPKDGFYFHFFLAAFFLGVGLPFTDAAIIL
jgi:hypothetical protein